MPYNKVANGVVGANASPVVDMLSRVQVNRGSLLKSIDNLLKTIETSESAVMIPTLLRDKVRVDAWELLFVAKILKASILGHSDLVEFYMNHIGNSTLAAAQQANPAASFAGDTTPLTAPQSPLVGPKHVQSPSLLAGSPQSSPREQQTSSKLAAAAATIASSVSSSASSESSLTSSDSASTLSNQTNGLRDRSNASNGTSNGNTANQNKSSSSWATANGSYSSSSVSSISTTSTSTTANSTNVAEVATEQPSNQSTITTATTATTTTSQSTDSTQTNQSESAFVASTASSLLAAAARPLLRQAQPPSLLQLTTTNNHINSVAGRECSFSNTSIEQLTNQLSAMSSNAASNSLHSPSQTSDAFPLSISTAANGLTNNNNNNPNSNSINGNSNNTTQSHIASSTTPSETTRSELRLNRSAGCLFRMNSGASSPRTPAQTPTTPYPQAETLSNGQLNGLLGDPSAPVKLLLQIEQLKTSITHVTYLLDSVVDLYKKSIDNIAQ